MEVATNPTLSENVIKSSQDVNLLLESNAMSANQTVHSSYVPAQLHRHLQFLDFNQGNFRRIGV